MKRLILVASAVLFAALSAHARLGETLDALATRYGQPTPAPYTVEYIYRDYGDTQAWYATDDLNVLVVFKNGISQYEMVMPKDPTAKLTQSVIRAFLEANASGSTWLAPKETATATNWTREDGKARAALSAEKKTLAVMVTAGGREKF